MLGLEGSRSRSQGKASGNIVEENKVFVYVYLAFFSIAAIGYQTYRRELGLSTFITLAVFLQFLAYSLLATKVIQQRSVRGISAKALQCHALVYCSRLSSTTWLKGYIPADSTGEGLYQAMDFLSLAMVLCLLYCAFKRNKDTYQADQDTFEIGYLVAGCFFLAVLLHPDLNDRPMFDTMWTFALYVDVFAMMPQIWMVSKIEVGGEMDAMNAHYIAAIAASRGVSLIFWYYGFREFAPADGGFNTSGWAIMGAHVIQCMLLLDFVAFYLKACVFGCVKVVQTGQYSQPTMTMSSVYDL